MINNLVLYFHRKPNGQVFYVGIGTPERPWSKDARNRFWKYIVKKYGYCVEIIRDNMTKDEAIEAEKLFIKIIGRRDLKTGTLVNLTEGGDGLLEASQITKNKIANSLRGRKNKPHSLETRIKISIANTGRKPSEKTLKAAAESAHLRSGEKHYGFGKKRSKETIEKIKSKLKGRTNTPEQINRQKESRINNGKYSDTRIYK